MQVKAAQTACYVQRFPNDKQPGQRFTFQAPRVKLRRVQPSRRYFGAGKTARTLGNDFKGVEAPCRGVQYIFFGVGGAYVQLPQPGFGYFRADKR